MSARSKSKNREGSPLFPSAAFTAEDGAPRTDTTDTTLHSLWQIVVIIIISCCWNYNCPVVDNSVAVHHCLGFFEHRKCDCRWHLTRNVPLSLGTLLELLCCGIPPLHRSELNRTLKTTHCGSYCVTGQTTTELVWGEKYEGAVPETRSV